MLEASSAEAEQPDDGNAYKAEFKYFKSRRPPPDLFRVLDFHTPTANELPDVKKLPLQACASDARLEHELGLMRMQRWSCWTLADSPGLLVLPAVLTDAGQLYWARRCLADFTRPPSRLNLDRHGLLPSGKLWWDACLGNPALASRLRWATLGYHHDWDTKVYTEQNRSCFPGDLAELCKYVAAAATGVAMTPQAAIVNFYTPGSTLAGHADSSETNRSAPLVSISLGLPAVFLVGGRTPQVKPRALLLRSGDALVMSGESRLCLHGVPLVLASQSEARLHALDQWEAAGREEGLEGGLRWAADTQSMSDWLDQDERKRITDYLSVSRINMNVRQVLFDGETRLPEPPVS